MDEIEAKMAYEDKQVHKNLDSLAASKKLRGDTDLEKAAAAYARFTDIRKKIIVLSRENTNVRSLSISLGQKRKVTIMCQETLSALKQAILKGEDQSVSSPRSFNALKPGTEK